MNDILIKIATIAIAALLMLPVSYWCIAHGSSSAFELGLFLAFAFLFFVNFVIKLKPACKKTKTK